MGNGRELLDVEAVRDGFAMASSPGRLEIVRRSPSVLLDVAHNPHGATALALALESAFTFDRVIGVVGIFADKDARAFLEILEPALNEVIVTQSNSERALPESALFEIAVDIYGADRVHRSGGNLADAITHGLELAEEPGSALLITGSVATVGQARTLLSRRP